jgi:hypothetical protein
MNCVVLYEVLGGIRILIPADCHLTLEQIIRKDIPADSPRMVVQRSQLPQAMSVFDGCKSIEEAKALLEQD